MKCYVPHLFLLWCFISCAQDIRLNQIGFYPEQKKVAVVPVTTNNSFIVVNTSEQTVFSGTLKVPKTWDYSGEKVQIADFSSLQVPGTYFIRSGEMQSPPFKIKRELYTDLLKASAKAYYYNRASTALDKQYAGEYERMAGHPDNQVLIHASAESPKRPKGSTIKAPKGWYDAGDYNKYVVNSGISTYTLLLAYDRFPEVFDNLNWNIPESQNKIPDILDEIKWNLDWMLAMQDPNDGGVYHKLTSLGFEGYVMPQAALKKRYVVQKTTAAALNFAAVLAKSYRVYQPFDEAYAKQCLQAAIKAWDWAQKNPNVTYQQPKDVTTGAYGDRSLDDEHFWAGVEMSLSTKNPSYLESISNWEKTSISVPSWSNVNALGWFSLALDKRTPSLSIEQQLVKEKLNSLASSLIESYQKSAYQVVMGVNDRDFVWGSNAVAANQAMLLMIAHLNNENSIYAEAAQANLDYILGRNATGYCFVTGYGDKQVQHPHHRPSEADQVASPIPGFLVGGPQAGQQDGCEYPSNLPAKSYSDSMCSYATNEVTINWNAPLVFSLAAIIDYEKSKQK